MALCAVAMISCSKSTPKADLKTDVDSLSYAFGYDQSQQVKEFLTRMEIDTAYMDEFIKGLLEGVDGGNDKRKAAYNMGLSLSQQLVMMHKNASLQLFQGDSTRTLSMDNFMAGFVAGSTGEKGPMTIDQARMIEQTLSQSIAQKAVAEKYAPNKEKSRKFMEQVAKRKDVKKLGKGVYYKVIKAGTGNIPSDSVKVKINYEGKNSDGKVFQSTYTSKEPLTMPVKGTIPGFTEALVHMPVGSIWEVYIPYEQAYNDRKTANIDPFSALVFKIELLSIEEK